MSGPREDSLREVARRAIGRALAARGLGAEGDGRPMGVHVDVRSAAGPARPETEGARRERRPGRELVSARCVARVGDGGEPAVPEGALVTPMAREEAQRRGIRLRTGIGDRRTAGEGRGLRVAVGSDHGGFEAKARVLEWVREWGHVAVDLGTRDENPVDYPDFAGAVARAVAGGQVDYGICVDGAGIGSAMVANKIAGVRAANCWNEASARNAREHNYANVLTLGGRMLDAETLRQVVRTFLSTPQGPERHARRVAKIDALDGARRSFSR